MKKCSMCGRSVTKKKVSNTQNEYICSKHGHVGGEIFAAVPKKKKIIDLFIYLCIPTIFAFSLAGYTTLAYVCLGLQAIAFIYSRSSIFNGGVGT